MLCTGLVRAARLSPAPAFSLALASAHRYDHVCGVCATPSHQGVKKPALSPCRPATWKIIIVFLPRAHRSTREFSSASLPSSPKSEAVGATQLLTNLLRSSPTTTAHGTCKRIRRVTSNIFLARIACLCQRWRSQTHHFLARSPTLHYHTYPQVHLVHDPLFPPFPHPHDQPRRS